MTRTTRIAKLLLSSMRVARTLYHGTIIDNEDSIRTFGLMGGVGSFVEHSYGEYIDANIDLPDLVFAADKNGLDNAVSAMVHHIGVKLNKDFHDVTDNDILNYGLLVIIYDEDNSVEQRPEDDDKREYPHSVEPGDYYSESLGADKFVKGRSLLRLLKRYNAWPRHWGPEDSSRIKKMRGWLISFIIKSNPEKDKQEIIDWVKGLSVNQINQYSFKYRTRGY